MSLKANVEFVRFLSEVDPYAKYKPRDPNVWEAMARVDRGSFLDDDVSMMGFIQDAQFVSSLGVLVAIDDLEGLAKAAKRIHDEMLLAVVETRYLAYTDKSIGIRYKKEGDDSQPCSQPSLVAYMADLLELRPGQKVLEIGTCSGYSAAIASEIIGPTGRLVSLERIPELAAFGEANLRRHFGECYDERIKVITGDGSVGFMPEAPYDRIYLTAGVSPTFDDLKLGDQLNQQDGVLLVPYILSPQGNGLLVKFTSKNGSRQKEQCAPVSFVPIIGENA